MFVKLNEKNANKNCALTNIDQYVGNIYGNTM